MNRLAQFLALLVLSAAASGCVSPRAYFIDRWNDAKDVLTVGGGLGLGAKVHVGPMNLGLLASDSSYGLRGGELVAADWDFNEGDVNLLIIFADACYGGHERGKDYAAIGVALGCTTELKPYGATEYDTAWGNPAYWSQIEVVVGAGAAVRLGFNPGELLDFLLGWLGADIYNDDIEARREGPPVKKPKQPPTPPRPPPSKQELPQTEPRPD